MVLLVSSVYDLEPGSLMLLLLIMMEELLSFATRKKVTSLIVKICFFLCLHAYFFSFLSFAFSIMIKDYQEEY